MELENKQVIVFGNGKSGKSAYRLLKAKKANAFIVDAIPPQKTQENFCLESESEELFKNCDLVILSPGISIDHPLIKNIKSPIWSEIELASHYCKVPIIAVTGTNGKTTTVQMIKKMFELAGKEVFVGGNIGTPFSDYVLSHRKYEIVILEISSYQLESIHNLRPHVAIITNVSPHHIERHKNFQTYKSIKKSLCRHLTNTDYVIYPENLYSQLPGKNIPFNQKIISKSCENFQNFSLIGQHNLENFYCAMKAAECFHLPKFIYQKTYESFTGDEFRCEKIPSIGKIKYYNDAKSTNFNATLSAVTSLKSDNSPLFLIFGGSPINDYQKYKEELNKIEEFTTKIYLIGKSTENLQNYFPNSAVKCFDLETAVKKINKEVDNGVVLFSPGHPSFDQYQNYIARGQAFRKLILLANNGE